MKIRTRYDRTNTDPSTAIVEAIARIEDVDSVALGTDRGILLTEHIDPDALDSLLMSNLGGIDSVSLTIENYKVGIDTSAVVVERVDET